MTSEATGATLRRMIQMYAVFVFVVPLSSVTAH